MLYQSRARLKCQNTNRKCSKNTRQVLISLWSLVNLGGLEINRCVYSTFSFSAGQLCFFRVSSRPRYWQRARCLPRNIKPRQTYTDRSDNVGKTSQTIKYTYVDIIRLLQADRIPLMLKLLHRTRALRFSYETIKPADAENLQ